MSSCNLRISDKTSSKTQNSNNECKEVKYGIAKTKQGTIQ